MVGVVIEKKFDYLVGFLIDCMVVVVTYDVFFVAFVIPHRIGDQIKGRVIYIGHCRLKIKD